MILINWNGYGMGTPRIPLDNSKLDTLANGSGNGSQWNVAARIAISVEWVPSPVATVAGMRFRITLSCFKTDIVL